MKDPLAGGAIFVGTAYLLGVLAHVSTRLFIDTVSKNTFRWWLLKLWNPNDFTSWDKKEILETYDEKLQAAISSESTEGKVEVGRRRERGRMLRSLAVPVGILLWHSGWECWKNLVLLLVVIIASVILYAYSEVMVYQESKLAASPNMRDS